MSDNVITVLVALLGSGLVSGLIAILSKAIERRWSKDDTIAKLVQKTNKNELDSVRLQMLVMISDYPDDKAEILRIAEHYFVELKGNWYMTSIFNKWLELNDIAKPEWFKND